ncbi:unnamed protein product [Boreogadus saida]
MKLFCSKDAERQSEWDMRKARFTIKNHTGDYGAMEMGHDESPRTAATSHHVPPRRRGEKREKATAKPTGWRLQVLEKRGCRRLRGRMGRLDGRDWC